MRVFMLIRYLDYSGAPKIFLWVARSLAERGHQVTICTFGTTGCVKAPDSVKWVDLTSEHLGFWGKIIRIRHIIKHGKYDVSISFLLDGNVYNLIACYGQRTKSVVCERSDPFKPHYYKLKFWKPWFRLADGAVFQLPKVAEYYSNIKARTAVIPNPLFHRPVLVLKPFEERDKEIISIGRIDIVQKRNDIMLKAFKLFLNYYPDFKLRIYGDGLPEDMRQFNKIIAKEHLEKSVIYEGTTPNPLELLSKSKFFLITSDFEGIPNALMEAMSIGMPCISTDCRPGGAAMLIDSGKNGILVPRGDILKIVESMVWLMNHPQKADLMGESAKDILYNFSEEEIKEKWEKYLLHLVSNN